MCKLPTSSLQPKKSSSHGLCCLPCEFLLQRLLYNLRMDAQSAPLLVATLISWTRSFPIFLNRALHLDLIELLLFVCSQGHWTDCTPILLFPSLICCLSRHPIIRIKNVQFIFWPKYSHWGEKKLVSLKGKSNSLKKFVLSEIRQPLGKLKIKHIQVKTYTLTGKWNNGINTLGSKVTLWYTALLLKKSSIPILKSEYTYRAGQLMFYLCLYLYLLGH